MIAETTGSVRPAPDQVTVIGIVGTGAVGASWATLFLARGLTVVAYDPAPDAEVKARAFISEAWQALMVSLGTPAKPVPGERLQFLPTVDAVARAAQVIQENAPERPELKTELLAAIDAAATAEKPILSSTGGIPPSTLQKSCTHPERFVVVHPFNPAHLIPLVEVVGGVDTDPAVIEWAMGFAHHVGKHPIRLLREADGHMTNRLQFALMREAVHCLVEGIASASDIDDAVRYGLGPRWALMGGLLTMHLAGGAGGMKGILDHAGKAIEGWWDALGQPRLDEPTRVRLIEAATEVSAGRSIAEWVQWRDRNLADLVKLIQHSANPATQETTNQQQETGHVG
jgi:3-hydroxyacyl-CoA dehydrogenase